MALRFQGADDDVDREVRKSRGDWLWPGRGVGSLLLFVFFVGACYFASDVFISGKSIDRAFRDFAITGSIFLVAVLVVEGLVIPKYREFRIRTTEILGTVNQIDKAVSAVKESQGKLLERLSAVEEELRSLKYQE